ncbi:uncharacterized protein LOC119094893 [Pollicipes pollicipes]|uniref:uncharacterized protein LOC119094893 n=1 Tax=Pollicipes pollicipes TaxID=41117 RepID=UPI001884E6B2|nr:uncharacterized protein LOC119094893 [Pollicipes pollicipes]
MALPAVWDYLQPVSTAVGLVTAVVLLGVGVDMAYHAHWTAVVTLGSFLVVLVLEGMSVPEACFQLHLRSSPAAPQWPAVQSLGPIRRALVHALLALLVLLTPHHRMTVTAAAGVLLFVCCGLQLLLAYVRWKQRREQSRVHLLGAADFGSQEDESPDRDSPASSIVLQREPEQI